MSAATIVRSAEELDRPSSVGKALALLSSFSPDRPMMGLSEIARRSGVPKSTAYRLLGSLVRASLVVRHGTDYAPGARLLELAALTAPERTTVREVALPYLLDLYVATHEAVHLAVRADDDVLVLETIRGHDATAPAARAGVRVPAGTSALGKAMLAFGAPIPGVEPPPDLELVRKHRVAFDRGMTTQEIVCVAAPILGRYGAVLGAVSVSGPVRRFCPPEWAVPVRRAAAAIARTLG